MVTAIGLGTPTKRDRYRGKFETLIALQTAIPTALHGDRAQVDPGSGTDATQYFYDEDEGWRPTGTGGGGGTPTVKKVQEFTADGIVDNWDVSNGTLDQIDFVVVGGIIMKPSTVAVAGQNVDIGSVPDAGTSVEVHYFEDISIGGGASEDGTVVFCGNYDATSDKLPGEVGAGAFVGTGIAGAIKKGNMGVVNVASTTDGLYPVGTVFIAKIDAPTLATDYIINY